MPELSPAYPIDGVHYRTPEFVADHIASGDWLDTTIGAALRATAAATPGKTAILDGDARLNFARLDAMSESVAAGLLDLGLAPGDRVLFQVGTNKDYFIAYFGCLKAGIVPVCTLPQFRMHDMLHYAERTAARGIVVQADINPNFNQLAFVHELKSAAPTIDHVIAVRGGDDKSVGLDALATQVDLVAARERTKHVALTPNDVAVFQLSGGSTSLPKIIPRMHGEYLAATKHLGERYELTGDDISLWSLPLVHNAGTLFVVLPVALVGRSLVLYPKLDAHEMLKLVEAHKVTFSGSIGPVAARMLELDNLGDYDLTSLRQFFTLQRAEAIENHMHIPVGQMFGMTEGMVLAAPPSAPAALRHHTCGYPVSARDEVRIVDPDTSDQVAFGEIGELVFRGPSAMAGYFSDSDANAQCLTADNFIRTGDLMRAHLIGDVVAYSFEGRIKDNINRGGEKIGAEEIEMIVGQHPGVADVKVVAMPDPVYGEKACAYIIMDSGHAPLSLQTVLDFMLSRGAAKYKCPERIELVTQYPLTRVGKVDKAALRAMIAEKLSAENAETVGAKAM